MPSELHKLKKPLECFPNNHRKFKLKMLTTDTALRLAWQNCKVADATSCESFLVKLLMAC